MWFNNKDPSSPKEILNWRLWYGVFCFGLMGAARGIDEGLIGTSVEQKSWQRLFKMGDEYSTRSEEAEAELLGNITSMVQVRYSLDRTPLVPTWLPRGRVSDICLPLILCKTRADCYYQFL